MCNAFSNFGELFKRVLFENLTFTWRILSPNRDTVDYAKFFKETLY